MLQVQHGARRDMTRRELLRRGLALGVGASAVALVVAACSTTRDEVPATIPPRITPITSQPGLIINATPSKGLPAGAPGSGTPGAGTPAATPAP